MTFAGINFSKAPLLSHEFTMILICKPGLIMSSANGNPETLQRAFKTANGLLCFKVVLLFALL